MDFGGFNMAFFPTEQGSLGGALCKGEWYKPSQDGVVIYFSVNPDLNTALSKVEIAGGKVIMPKKQISEEYGYMGMFIDSEGNRIALHSQN
jgi:predicted enzyme related to lactoylglutathione lyase